MVNSLGCCVILHNFVLTNNDSWTEEDGAILLDPGVDAADGKIEADIDAKDGKAMQTDAEAMQIAVQLRVIVRSRCIAFNKLPGGVLAEY